MKIFCSLLCLLALCACDAFDEGRLTARRSSFVHTQDASTTDESDPEVRDAATLDGAASNPVEDGDEPRVQIDASAIDDEPDAPPVSICDDEDAGSHLDGDEDGIPDCEDRCPLDPGKVNPGVCGCGHAELEGDGVASCKSLISGLAHRFRFDGTGTTVRDDRGNASGAIVNASLTGQGAISLAGGTSDQYVDLPNDLISGLTNVTIEAWVTWNGGSGWQRIFDFGDSDVETEGENSVGSTYLMLSPLVNDRSLGAAFASAGADSAIFVESAESLAIGTMQHVALVFDDDSDQMKLFLNGTLVGGAVVEGTLSAINDRNNWLGRSQFAYDAGFDGMLHELRIYGRALSAAHIALSHEYGTDPAFLSD